MSGEALAERSRPGPEVADLEAEVARLTAANRELVRANERLGLQVASLAHGRGEPGEAGRLPEPDGVFKVQEPGLRPPAPLSECLDPAAGPTSDLVRNRRAYLLPYISASHVGLEIGPFRNPTILKGEGDIRYVDYYSREELASQVAPEEVAEIAPVDYVVKAEDYLGEIAQRFDYIIANHVMEHVANVIRWLEMLNEMLVPGGLLYIAIPDKKYNFDRFRSDTDFSHLVADYFRGVTEIDREHCLDLALNYDRSYIGQTRDLGEWLTRERLRQAFDAPTHVGAHSHVFQSETFLSKILCPLLKSGFLEFDLIEYQPAPLNRGEILFLLKKRPPTVTVDPDRFYTLSPYASPAG